MSEGNHPGEHLEFIDDAVAQALGKIPSTEEEDISRWLFEILVDTALDLPEVCLKIQCVQEVGGQGT